MAQRYKITNGPSKWDLMLGLFDNTASNPREVEFTIADSTEDPGPGEPVTLIAAKFVLNVIGRESGSGEDWIFEGYNPRHPLRPAAKGYFSTRTRSGHVEV